MTFWQFLDKHFDAIAGGAGALGVGVFFAALIWGDPIVAALVARWRRR